MRQNEKTAGLQSNLVRDLTWSPSGLSQGRRSTHSLSDDDASTPLIGCGWCHSADASQPRIAASRLDLDMVGSQPATVVSCELRAAACRTVSTLQSNIVCKRTKRETISRKLSFSPSLLPAVCASALF